MSSPPILSILITFCNQKEYVQYCIDSLLYQKTSYSYEILIAVDGKDDGTINLLKSYQNDAIQIYKVESNPNKFSASRVSENRLFLLNKARGKYFITLDGDDFFISPE